MVLQTKKTKKNQLRKKALLFTLAMVALPMIQFIIFWGYVNFDSIIMAFKVGDGWGLDHFRKIFDAERGDFKLLVVCLKNSLINLAINQFITLPLVTILSYFLYKKCFGAGIFRVLFFLPSLISAVVMAGLFSSLMSSSSDGYGPILSIIKALNIPIDEKYFQRGLISGDNSYRMIMLYCIWTGVGTNLVLLSGGLARAPQDLFEAAKIDGAGMWKEFKTIAVPILWPTITTLFIFNLAGCFTMYLPVLLLDQTNSKAHTIGFFLIQRTNMANGNPDAAELRYAAAIGLVFTVITVPVILFVKWLFNKISEALEF